MAWGEVEIGRWAVRKFTLSERFYLDEWDHCAKGVFKLRKMKGTLDEQDAAVKPACAG
jgi:hypothetical protein